MGAAQNACGVQSAFAEKPGQATEYTEHTEYGKPRTCGALRYSVYSV